MNTLIKKRLKYLAYFLLATLVIMQFFGIDKTAPEYDLTDDFITMTQPNDEVKSILKTSCYDCHSFETVYPWYSNIAPVSWWLKDHVNEGRSHLNFSTWANYEYKRADHKLEEVIEMMEEDEMPLNSYLITHGDAKLSAEQSEALISFTRDLRKSMEEGKPASE